MQAQLITVAEGVHAWIGAGGDSNAGAIETPDGLIAIDAQQYPRLARAFRQAAEAKTGKRFIELVDTHCHLDHTAGNIVFADVPILAHEKTLAAMHANLGAKTGANWTLTDYSVKARFLFGQNLFDLVPLDSPGQAWFRQRISLADYDEMVIAPPTRTFADDFAYHLAHDTMRLKYWGPAHCDGDIVVVLEKAKVVFLGDLLFYGRFPWLGDCDLDGWIDRLASVLKLDVDVVVPGHGMPATLKEVAAFRGMLVALRAGVAASIKAGASEDAAARETRLPAYASIPRYDDWLPVDVRAVYRYLKAH